MTSPTGPGDRASELATTRRLLVDLRRHVDTTVDDLVARLDTLAAADEATPAAPTYSRPAAVPPRRMEQMVRTPEPTADLDDLVDVLAPRLLERLVPALRDALADVG